MNVDEEVYTIGESNALATPTKTKKQESLTINLQLFQIVFTI